MNCPECSGRGVSERGECFCNDCGLVLGVEYIETREMGDIRRGLADRGLSTVIPQGFPASGKLRYVNGRTHTRQSGVLNKHLKAIDNMCGLFGVPRDVRDFSLYIFRHYGDLVKGMERQSVYCACVLLASRRYKHPLSYRRCEREYDCTPKFFKRAITNLNRELAIPPLVAEDYIPYMCSYIGVGSHGEQKARAVLEELGVVSRSPVVVAGAVVKYCHGDMWGVNTRIMEALDISEPILLDCYRFICEKKGLPT